MDSIDVTLLRALMRDGRITWAALAKRAGLSPAALAQRVRRLERRGVIAGYEARVDPDAVGAGLLAFVTVRIASPKARARFATRVRALPWIQECHHVTGDADYLLKVGCAGTRDLERLISVELKDRCGVTESRTSVALDTVKETIALPIPEQG